MLTDIDDILIFSLMVENGGFNSAARRLEIPKSTLSRRISNLERKIGFSLFHRDLRPFMLTSRGEEFYSHCASLVVEAKKVEDLIALMSSPNCGLLKIICPPLLAERFVEQIANEYMTLSKETRIHLESAPNVIDPRLKSCDLVLYPAFSPLPDVDVIGRKICTFDYSLVCSKIFINELDRCQAPSELQSFPCLGLGPTTSEYQWHLKNSDGLENIVGFTPVFSTTEVTTLHRACLRGLGIAALPTKLCNEDIKAGGLVPVLSDWRPMPVTIYATYPKSSMMSAANRKFLEFLLERLPNAVNAWEA